jgi:serine/threonine-protein kinase
MQSMNASPENDRPLDEVLAAYLESVETGTAPDPAQLLARYPEWADQLAAFFADQDRFASFLKPLSAPETGGESGALETGASVPAAGEQFGDYELLEEIGRGGMGVVFKARQRSLPRIVALKMILSGQRASPPERERFRLEAEAAARLDHPHIVPTYEVGTYQGLPFYSMRLLPGGNLADRPSPRPLTREDQKRTARLLATVAEAVHHAHQRGVLHRDLKPANILLDAEGQPHVADFGLAKRLEEDGASSGRVPATPPGAAVGTPSYMAPEQALGPKAVTTAADVYSLGCILYELLTGRPPFRAETPLATLLDVLERSPPRPSSLCPGLDRDLETVCLKCLEKEPLQRYGSAAALAEDLRRFAAGEPIHGRPTSRLGRLRRWCRRQPLLASTLAALVVVVLTALGLISWQWRRAESNYRESQREKEAGLHHLELAEERFRLAHDLVEEFGVRLSEDRLKYLPGTQTLRKDLLESAGRYYQRFLEQKGEDASLRRRLAGAHFALAGVHGSLGARAEALAEYRAALDLYDELLRQSPGMEVEGFRARTLLRIGILHAEAGRWADALGDLTPARTAFTSLVARSPGDPGLQTDQAGVLANLGNVYRFKGDPAGALPYLEEALAIRKRVAAAEPENRRFQAVLAATYLNYGNLVSALGRGRESLDCYRRAQAINAKLVEAAPREPEYQSALALVLRLIGERERLSGQREKALETFADARTRLERLVQANPDVVHFECDLAATYRQIGHTYFSGGKKDEALKWYRQGRDAMEKARRLQPDLPEVWNDLAKCWFDMGTASAFANPRSRETLQAFEEASALREKVVRASPDHPDYRHDLALTCGNLAVTLSNLGRSEEAEKAARRAVEEDRRLLDVAPQVAKYRQTCSEHLGLLATLQWSAGRYGQALANVQARADLWPKDGQELCTVARDFARAALTGNQGTPADQRGRAEQLVLELLRRAVAAGFRDRQRLQTEKAFTSLRPRKEFQELLARLK